MTNREKLALLRNELEHEMLEDMHGTRIGLAFRILAELLGLLIGTDGAPIAEERPLHTGDVVRLRSGGPSWTTLHTEASSLADLVHVARAVGEFAPAMRDVFPAAALVRVADEQRSAQRENKLRAVLVEADGLLRDIRQAHEGRQLTALEAAELVERVMVVRGLISAALTEDA